MTDDVRTHDPKPAAGGSLGRIGRYELHRLLGEGGMGRVWEATLRGPAGFRKRVALKELKRGDGLIREARLGGLLQHPHLVDVYALEQIDGRWLCAMELVQGGSLAGCILPPRAVVEVGLQVAEGLAHAHREVGLVHLDLKPSNLLLQHGRVKVADLGISKARDFANDVGIRGTPAYMAPEQRLGEELDARTDVYALGVVLTALATGTPCRHPEAVPWLAEVLRRCLPVEARARFESMDELATALRKVEVSGPGLVDWTHPDLGGALDSLPTDHPTSTPGGTPGSAYRALTNLPSEPDAFVGRAEDQGSLLSLLSEPGLVTIKGSGGLGKTRLGLRVARTWHAQTRHPSWLVDLREARSAGDLIAAVAEVLAVPLGPGSEDELADSLGWAIQSRGELLLLLDNVEQVSGAAPVLDKWRSAAPRCRLLITSREPLRLRGERIHELGSLSEEEAVALLLGRARAEKMRGDPALPEIVRQLDALPLALELAASRLRVLGPSGLLKRLDRRFSLLRRREPGLSPREATLRGTLDWSWEMLSPDERSALAQCSVFADGFTIEAAEQVVRLGGDEWVLDVLQGLLERSLLIAESTGRLGMLVSVRAYVQQADPASATAARARHIGFFARLGSPVSLAALSAGGGLTVMRERSPEVGNCLAACRAAIADREPRAVPLLAAVWSLLQRRGPFRTVVELGKSLLDVPLSDTDRGHVCLLVGAALQASGERLQAGPYLEAAARSAEPRLQAEVQRWRGIHLRRLGDFDGAKHALVEGMSVAETAGQRARLSSELAVVYQRLGQVQLALATFEESARALRASGDRAFEGRVLGNLGNLFVDMGRTRDGLAAYERSLRRHREAGAVASEAVVRTNLAGLRLERGEFDEAERQYRRALGLHRSTGHRQGEAHVLGDLGVICAQRGQNIEAEEAYRHAIDVYASLGDEGGVAHCLYNLGGLLLRSNRTDAAETALSEAMERYASVGDQAGVGCSLGALGSLARIRGDLVLARTRVDSALEEIRAAGLSRAEGAFLGESAVLAAMAGDRERAESELAAGERIHRDRQDRVQLALIHCRRAESLHHLGDSVGGAESLELARGLQQATDGDFGPLSMAIEQAEALLST